MGFAADGRNVVGSIYDMIGEWMNGWIIDWMDKRSTAK